MSEEEAVLLKEAMRLAFSKDSARPPQGVYALLSNKLLKWPAASVFPVLDVLRLLVLNPYAAKAISSAGAEFFEAAVALCAGAPEQVPAPTRVMALRLFANCFRNVDMRAAVAQHAPGVLAAARGSGAFANAQVPFPPGGPCTSTTLLSGGPCTSTT